MCALSGKLEAACEFVRQPKRRFIEKSHYLRIITGGPRRIRTPDPLIRSQVLYPAELSDLTSEGVF